MLYQGFVYTKQDFCCNQNKFHWERSYAYHPGPLGMGEHGTCVICGKQWEIDDPTVLKTEFERH